MLRQLGATELLVLVGRIERLYRERIGAADLADDDVVTATLRREGSAAETAALSVIRACIAVRENRASHGGISALWLDALTDALHCADAVAHPDRALGSERRAQQQRFASLGANLRSREREHARWQAEAAKLRRNPQHGGKSKAAIAAIVKKTLRLSEAPATIAKRIR
jgi:hypothetical protein